MKTKILLLAGYFLFAFLLSLPFYSGDIKNHLVWGKSIVSEGPVGFYGRSFHDYAFPNYPPLAMGFFAAGFESYSLSSNLIWQLNTSVGLFPSRLVSFWQWENMEISFLKLPALLAPIGIAVAMWLLLGLDPKIKEREKYLAVFLVLLNPAIIYLSFVWGQIDLLPVMFLLFAFYLLFKKRLWWAFLLSALALLSKQTVIVFWAIFVFMAWRKFGLVKTAGGVLLSVAVFYLAYLPFHAFSLTWPLELYRTNFSLVAESVGENSLNMWGALFAFQSHSDLQRFFLLTFQQWGYLLFAAIAGPLVLILNQRKFAEKDFWQVLFLVTITYFFVLTRMHERYLIPAIVFSALAIPFTKKMWLPFVFFSLLQFLNLYRGLYQPDISFLTAQAKSVPILTVWVLLYLLTLCYLIYNFVRKVDE